MYHKFNTGSEILLLFIIAVIVVGIFIYLIEYIIQRVKRVLIKKSDLDNKSLQNKQIK